MVTETSNSENTLHNIQLSPVADLVVGFIRQQGGGCTFVEIIRYLQGIGFPAGGDLKLANAELNVVLWAGVSAEFVALMEQLRASGRLVPRPTSILIYLFDGAILNYPLAVKPPANGYKKPRWIPTVFDVAKPKGSDR